MNNDKSKILVSICCITYNHAPFIRKALDGFLMQQAPSCVPQGSKMSDWCEILIHDDCSTDGTTEIIKEYAAKYPDLIFPLYEEVNQYSQGKENVIDMYNYGRAHGKYIAYCEGDDYWTDSYKLQKQVDFMESYLDYSVCFHCFRNYRVNEDVYIENTQPTQLLKQYGAIDGMDIDMDTYFSGWFTQPLTMLFRVSMYNFDVRKKYKHFRDMHDIYYLLKVGKCRLLKFDGGVRNVHDGGIASAISREKYCEISLPMDREFYWKTLDKGPKKTYLETLEECVKIFRNTDKREALRCTLVHFAISRHLRGLIRHIKMILGKE